MTAETMIAWLFSAMIWRMPPETTAAVSAYPEARETAEERTERYFDIAVDITEAVSELPDGQQKQAAATLLALALAEGGLARDVDLGPCAPARIAKGGCDAGRARSLWQLHGIEPESRLHAARVALRRVSASSNSCRHLPREARLAVYASGTCFSTKGQQASRVRVALADRIAAFEPR